MKTQKKADLRAVAAPATTPSLAPNRAAVLRLFGIEEPTPSENTTPELVARYFAPYEALPFALEEALSHEAYVVRMIGFLHDSEISDDLDFLNFAQRTARRIEILSQLISRAKSAADKDGAR